MKTTEQLRGVRVSAHVNADGEIVFRLSAPVQAFGVLKKAHALVEAMKAGAAHFAAINPPKQP